MDLDGLKTILNGGYPDDVKRQLIIKIIAADEAAIPDILDLLAAERKRKKKVINEINFQLSRAHVGLLSGKFDKKGVNGDRFMEKEIEAFYHKFKDDVRHLFKKLEEMKPPDEKSDFGFNDYD